MTVINPANAKYRPHLASGPAPGEAAHRSDLEARNARFVERLHEEAVRAGLSLRRWQ